MGPDQGPDLKYPDNGPDLEIFTNKSGPVQISLSGPWNHGHTRK